ncbi:IKI3 family-domain-containing protein [Scleroderma yunnanense]
MRNLAQVAVQVVTLHAEAVGQFSNVLAATLSTTAFDIDRDITFVATESSGAILIWKTEGNHLFSLEEPSFSFCGSYVTSEPCIASLRVLADSSRLALITRAGDIVVWELGDTGNFDSDSDIQGTVDMGILAASWSPDDTLLTLATSENVILMTSTLDVISEVPLETNEFGEGADTPITVGWGSKETQFHGSVGRAHLNIQEHTNTEENISDDGMPRITWRGDGAYFAVSVCSSQHPSRRVIRVYSHEGRLQSTSEPVSGLEASVAWRPNGGIIASTQMEVRSGPSDTRKSGKYDVVFFERNGLRHGEFSLRRPPIRDDSLCKVKDLVWSPDSAVLAVWFADTKGDTVQLWTTGNYHWYLKQEIYPSGNDHFTSVIWHPERPLLLVMTTPSQLTFRTYAWETCAGAHDTGCVGVVDGEHVLLTPFRTQNAPPPMSSHQLLACLRTSNDGGVSISSTSSLRTTPIHVSLSPSKDVLAVVWGNGNVAVWSLNTRIGPGTEKVMDPSLLWSTELGVEGKLWKQISVSVADKERILRVVVLSSVEKGFDQATVHEVQLSTTGKLTAIGENSWVANLPGKNGRLLSNLEWVLPFWQSCDGQIFSVDYVQDVHVQLCRFPEFCCWAMSFMAQSQPLFLGLSSNGKLYFTTEGSKPALLANNGNSFTVASGFVVFTTNAHEVQFTPITTLVEDLNAQILANDNDDVPIVATDSWQKRRVERGSRIVTVVPSMMSLVLQMPRGNLETINPRPLVMEVVKSDLDGGRWRKAFSACRKHRIDLNVIVEHNQEAFLSSVSAFINQVQDVDSINLFLTSIGRSQLSPKTITDVCDAIRCELETKNLSKYVNSILTAYVVKTPSDCEAGLALLLRLRELHPDLVEDAVKYIIFLVDANQLFDTALGMYDFTLVLLVAQHAQKDPREYLPFLRELRALPVYYQRFRIDDHLRRYSKALSNINLAGAIYFQEALDYIERHQLYETGLEIWKGTEQYSTVFGIYGSWLFERREYRQAALVFAEVPDFRKAMVAHERALEWQELFELSSKQALPEDEVKDMGYRIAEELLSKKRFSEAARVFIDYARDDTQAVVALVQGNEFSEARRIISLSVIPQLLEDVVMPGTLEMKAQFSEDLSEMREQLSKQVTRVKELRIKKVMEPGESSLLRSCIPL